MFYFNTIAVAAIGAITLYVGLFHLLFYSRNLKDRVNLYFSIMCFAVFLYDLFCVLFYQTPYPERAIWYQRGQFSTIALMALTIYRFIRVISKSNNPRIDRPLQLIYIIFVILPWIPGKLLLHSSLPAVRNFIFLGYDVRYLEFAPGPLLLIEFLLVLSGIGICFYRVVRLYRKAPEKSNLILITGFGFFVMTAIGDMLNASGLAHTIYLTEFGFFSLILIMDSSLLQKFIKAFKGDRKLNQQLERRVNERVSLIKELHDQLSISNQALEIKNGVLKELAERDGLTGLLNHATFQRRLSECCNMAWRHKIPLTVVMVDVDDFKDINDKLGHPEGDRVLLRIAALFNGKLRDYDVKTKFSLTGGEAPPLHNYDTAARYGGDEFALILPFCDAAGAQAVMNRLYEELKQMANSGPEPVIRLSCGCCSTGGKGKIEPERLIEMADGALYEAKQQGKGCFSISQYLGE